jgi:hypothetical protein
MRFTQQGLFLFGGPSLMWRSRALQRQPTPGEINGHAGGRLRRNHILQHLAWGKVGAVVAALALTYGVAMSIALVVYVYRYRGRRMMRR